MSSSDIPPESLPDSTRTVIREHAREQMVLREISEADVRSVLGESEDVLRVRLGRIVAQRGLSLTEPRP